MGAVREDFLENKRNRNIDNNIFKNLIKYVGNMKYNGKKLLKRKERMMYLNINTSYRN